MVMYKPEDVKIKKVEFTELNRTEYHVMVRVYKKVRIGWFKSELVPTDEFKLYTEYDGYYCSSAKVGICLDIVTANILKTSLLKPYYEQFKREEYVD